MLQLAVDCLVLLALIALLHFTGTLMSKITDAVAQLAAVKLQLDGLTTTVGNLPALTDTPPDIQTGIDATAASAQALADAINGHAAPVVTTAVPPAA